MGTYHVNCGARGSWLVGRTGSDRIGPGLVTIPLGGTHKRTAEKPRDAQHAQTVTEAKARA